MHIVMPSIAPEIADIAPGFRALSITVEAAPLACPEAGSLALMAACEALSGNDVPWAEAHLDAWDRVFKAFGAKPARTPCSARALRKRVHKEGSVPSIDPIVDLYNAVSIRYAIPVGGENLAAYNGTPRLVIADGTESFDIISNGERVYESPDAGEVIWRDESGVTCRRWNWRQGVRTRLSMSSPQMWFILESLPEMPPDALHQAGDELIAGLQTMMPGCTTRVTQVGV